MESYRYRAVPLTNYRMTFAPGNSVVTFESLNSWYFDQMQSTSVNGNFKDPTNQFIDKTISTMYRGSWSDISKDGQSGSVWNGPSPWSLSALPNDATIVGGVYNKALSRYNGKLRSELDLSVAAAEWSSTRRMFKSSYSAVNGLLRLAPKNWHKNWLEWQYGWRPLLQDVYNSAEEYVNYRRRNTVIEATASDGEQYASSRDWNGQSGVTEIRKKFSRYRCRIQGWYDVSDNTMQKAGNWASLNPLSIGWELVPYSFVVDWFLDVGSYLHNFETAMLYNVSFKRGFVTQGRWEQTNGLVSGSINPWWATSIGIYSLDAYVRHSYKLRQVLSYHPLPMMPRFNARLGAERMISAAALLLNLLDSKDKPRYIPKVRKFSNIRWSNKANTWKDLGVVDWNAFGRGHH